MTLKRYGKYFVSSNKFRIFAPQETTRAILLKQHLK